MIMRVVEGLEVVQVEKQQCAMVVAALAGCHGLVQMVQQQTAVGQAGEGVVEGPSSFRVETNGDNRCWS